MLWNSIQKQNSYCPEPKAAHSCDRIGNKLYIFGGWNGRIALDTLESFDLTREIWQVLISTGDKPSARNNHASCSFNEYLYIHGGHDGDDWLDDFYLLDTKNLIWKKIQITQYFPKARACHTLSRIGKKIYMYGGYDGKQSFADFEIFDTETHLWIRFDSNIQFSEKNSSDSTDMFLPNPRNAHSASVHNKKIYIFGGHFQNIHLNDLVIFDTVKNEWESFELKGVTPSGLRGHTATLIYNKLYIFGGYDGYNRNNDLYRVNIDGCDLNFTKITNNRDNIYPRQRHTAAVRNNKILFLGGFDGNKWLNNMDEINIPLLEYNISKENRKLNLKSDFRFLLNNKEYSDFIFMVQNEIIYAHKSILFARSEFFRNMFSEFMIENKSNLISIDICNSKTMLNFLEYLYCSEINCKEIEEIIELYKLADSYSMESLKNFCEEKASFMINSENAVQIYILGYKCNSTSLEKAGMDYILNNRKEIILTGSMNTLLEYPGLMVKILINL